VPSSRPKRVQLKSLRSPEIVRDDAVQTIAESLRRWTDYTDAEKDLVIRVILDRLRLGEMR
jgi:hypothetical protein